MITLFILFVILLICACIKYQMEKCTFEAMLPFNFPFKKYGKTFWYSRSVATVVFAFCKDKVGEWRVLAAKRGKGALDYQGYWNAPCGYLEFDVNGEENATKEVWEECGVTIEPSSLELLSVDTNPSSNRQNVTLMYLANLDGTTDDYNLSLSNMEDNEVEETRWLTFDEYKDLNWAFGHKELIEKAWNKLPK